ncbi:MAG: prepilin-type N-terminal cleavage/methylation domain-containing protein [Gemmatimonadota bacterium]
MNMTVNMRPTPRRSATRRGFTLIELMVTLLLLGVGLAGLVATSGAVSRMMGGSSREASAATIAASRFETLRGTACASVISGSATTRGVSESWRVTQISSRVFDVTDSVSFVPISRRAVVKQAYRSYVRC